jgi:hypothetical protein
MIHVVHVRKAPYTAKRFGLFFCLRMFEDYAREHLWNKLYLLDDQTLGCWCKPKACHGEVLKRLREEQLAHALRIKTISD